MTNFQKPINYQGIQVETAKFQMSRKERIAKVAAKTTIKTVKEQKQYKDE